MEYSVAKGVQDAYKKEAAVKEMKRNGWSRILNDYRYYHYTWTEAESITVLIKEPLLYRCQLKSIIFFRQKKSFLYTVHSL